jgi:hypothetical protein
MGGARGKSNEAAAGWLVGWFGGMRWLLQAVSPPKAPLGCQAARQPGSQAARQPGSGDATLTGLLISVSTRRLVGSSVRLSRLRSACGMVRRVVGAGCSAMPVFARLRALPAPAAPAPKPSLAGASIMPACKQAGAKPVPQLAFQPRYLPACCASLLLSRLQQPPAPSPWPHPQQTLAAAPQAPESDPAAACWRLSLVRLQYPTPPHPIPHTTHYMQPHNEGRP